MLHVMLNIENIKNLRFRLLVLTPILMSFDGFPVRYDHITYKLSLHTKWFHELYYILTWPAF